MAATVVQIQRRSAQEPWGFRLQGGSDYRMALCVKKTDEYSGPLVHIDQAFNRSLPWCRRIVVIPWCPKCQGHRMPPTPPPIPPPPPSHVASTSSTFLWYNKANVEPGSPCQGHLTPGDIILGIGGRTSQGLTHSQAHNMIKGAGNAIQLHVQKNNTNFDNIKPKGPVKFSPWKH